MKEMKILGYMAKWRRNRDEDVVDESWAFHEQGLKNPKGAAISPTIQEEEEEEQTATFYTRIGVRGKADTISRDREIGQMRGGFMGWRDRRDDMAKNGDDPDGQDAMEAENTMAFHFIPIGEVRCGYLELGLRVQVSMGNGKSRQWKTVLECRVTISKIAIGNVRRQTREVN